MMFFTYSGEAAIKSFNPNMHAGETWSFIEPYESMEEFGQNIQFACV